MASQGEQMFLEAVVGQRLLAVEPMKKMVFDAKNGEPVLWSATARGVGAVKRVSLPSLKRQGRFRTEYGFHFQQKNCRNCRKRPHGMGFRPDLCRDRREVRFISTVSACVS